MLFELCTQYQNALADQRLETCKYHQQMRNIYTKGLSTSFDDQSNFYVKKTSYLLLGRTIQLGVLTIFVCARDNNQIFQDIAKNLSPSNQIYDYCDKIFTPYYESKLPAVQSTQLMEQKKLETLSQLDMTETNKADRLQQTIQSAKDVYAQQLLKASSI